MTSLNPPGERRKAVWGSRRPRASVGRLCAVTLLMLGAAAQVSAQTKQCAVCYFANLPEVASHVSQFEWERSAYARNQVGCETRLPARSSWPATTQNERRAR